MKKNIYFILILLTTQAWSQTTFHKYLGNYMTPPGGHRADGGNGERVAKSPDNFFYVAEITGDTSWAMGLSCFDSLGVSKWTNSFALPNNQAYIYQVGGVKVACDKNVYSSWAITPAFSNPSHAVLLKTDSAGNLIYLKDYSKPGYSYTPNDLVTTADSGALVVGSTDYPGNGLLHFMAIRIKKNGDTLWTRILGGTNHMEGKRVEQTQDKGFIISITSATSSSINYMAKLDSAGNLTWMRSFITGSMAGIITPLPTSDGGALICGKTYSGNPAGGVVLKTNAAGNIVWGKKYTRSSAIPFSAGSRYRNGFAFVSDAVSLNYEPTIVYTDSSGNMYHASKFPITHHMNNIVPSDNGTLIACAYDDTLAINIAAFVPEKPCSELDITSQVTVTGFSPTWGAYTPSLITRGATDINPYTIAYVSNEYYPNTIKCSSLIPSNVSFSVSTSIICTGNCVNYSDHSGYAHSTYQWTFPGGNPSTSTAANPVVCYPNAGIYSATLMISTPDGTNSKTLNSMLRVDSVGIYTFQKHTGGAMDEDSPNSEYTIDKGLVVTVATSSTGNGGADVYVAKYDSTLTLVWQKTIGGTGDDRPTKIRSTSDGGFLVAGYTYSFGVGGGDIFIAKISASGTLQWFRNYGTANFESPADIIESGDGGYYICGKQTVLGVNHGIVFKIDFSGNIIYSNVVDNGAGKNIEYNKLLRASNGTVYALGVYKLSGTNTKFLATKFSDILVQNSSHYFEQNPTDIGGINGALFNSLGNIAITGYYKGPGSVNNEIILAELDTSMNVIWSKGYDMTGNEEGVSILQPSTGGYAFVGRTTSYGGGNDDIVLTRTDASGNLVWQNAYGGTANENTPYGGFAANPDGGFTIVGNTSSFTNGGKDLYILRTSACGLSGCNQSGSTPTTQTLPLTQNAILFNQNVVGFISNPISASLTNANLSSSTSCSTCTDPLAGFSATVSGMSLNFTNTSSNANGYTWNFGDGQTSTLTSPIHVYNLSGTYNVGLIVSNICGKDTLYQQITVVCAPPVAGFDTTIINSTVNFTDTSFNSVTHNWDFGDGQNSTLINPVHTYANSGTYTVCLITGNGCGTDTTCTSVSVTCAYPIAVYTSGVNGLTLVTNNSSQNGAVYNWDFGDGNFSSAMNPVHVYNNAGIYTVQLITSNGCGADTTSQIINVNCALPASNFVASINGLSGQFNGSASTNAYSYNWIWGDGSPGSIFTFDTHSYPTTGMYNVCLVTSNGCGTDTMCQVVSVCTPPQASFTGSAAGNVLSFVNSSTNGTSYFWNFGDGVVSGNTNPAHSYATGGNYNVCLIAQNTCGTDTTCATILTQCSSSPLQEICEVTVDTGSTHNVIFWDKTGISGVDSFYIYREITTNNYSIVGVVPYDSISEFHDYGANPNVTSYRYKIGFVDTCGVVTNTLSDYHNTIFITGPNAGGTFIFTTKYAIENQSNPVLFYELFRDDLSNGNWVSLATTPGSQNQIADPAYLSFPNARWKVETQWSLNCNSTRGAINTSRSNIKINSVNGIAKIDQIEKLLIYPNPFSNSITFELEADKNHTWVLEITNSLGQIVNQYHINNPKTVISTAEWNSGIYFYKLFNSSSINSGKITRE
jgi:PKD repeat protein